MISVKLSVVGGKHSGQVIPLNRKKFLIGREQDCQLRPNSELISRHHCVFTVDDFSVRVRDLGSTNGTLVNGERIRKEVVLQPGDRVLVGNLEFDVTIDELGTETPTTRVKAQADETVVGGTGTDTVPEMEPIKTPAPEAPPEPTTQQAPTQPAPGTETTAIEAQPAQTPAPPLTPPEMPMHGMGDTTVMSPTTMMPGQTPYQPMMPQQMGGYPQQQMYGNYPYPGMPQQMPPQQMPMYPQQGYPGAMPGYPQQQMPPTQPPAPAPAQPAAAPTPSPSDAPEVSLPDPSETGAKTEPPPSPKPESAEDAPAANEEPSNQSAAAIIQQHMQRKPGG